VRREYQLLVEGAEQGLARLNSNGLLLFCSKPLLELVGRERKELLGRNLLDLDLFAEGREELRQALGRLREGETAQPVLCALTGRGGLRQMELRLSPLRVEGEVTGILLQAQERVTAAPYLRMSNS
jgi:PAS domain S-box-containing protein